MHPHPHRSFFLRSLAGFLPFIFLDFRTMALIFFVSTIRQVILPSPGTLSVARGYVWPAKGIYPRTQRHLPPQRFVEFSCIPPGKPRIVCSEISTNESAAGPTSVNAPPLGNLLT